jgi:hypothetical protein
MLVRGGRVVTADADVVADVLVVGETIARVGASIDADADRVIDATGCYVLPGMVDPHTHLETPAGSTVTVDDFTSGSIAAAFGGTTTLVHFCVPAGGALPSWTSGSTCSSPTSAAIAPRSSWPSCPTRVSQRSRCSCRTSTTS